MPHVFSCSFTCYRPKCAHDSTQTVTRPKCAHDSTQTVTRPKCAHDSTQTVTRPKCAHDSTQTVTLACFTGTILSIQSNNIHETPFENTCQFLACDSPVKVKI